MSSSTWAIRAIAIVLVSAFASTAAADVSEAGAYQTGVRFEVPAYYGLEPDVGLSYSSTGANGSVGVGWRLAAGSTIKRLSSTYGAPHYDATDVFFVDGQELIPCADAPDSPGCSLGGATHAARIESFQRIVQNQGENTWTITARDGTQHRYVAQLGDTRWPETTYAWGLATVEDTAHHVIDYSYDCDGFTCYLTTISYGDGLVCDASHDGPIGSPVDGARIHFDWEPRVDFVSVGTGDDAHPFEEVRQRLRRVRILHAEGPVRSYVLDYAPAYGTSASLLRAVHELGSDGVTEAPLRSFAYPAITSPSSPAIASTTSAQGTFLVRTPPPLPDALPATWTGAAATLPALAGFGAPMWADVDGDGRADAVRIATSGDCRTMTIVTRLAGASTDVYSYLDWTSIHHPTPLDNTCLTNIRPADLNGDGLQDLVFDNWFWMAPTNDPRERLRLITVLATGGGSFAPPSQEILTAIEDDGVNKPSSCATGDVNGDQRDDYVCLSGWTAGSWDIVSELSIGNGLYQEHVSPGPAQFGSGRELRIVDVNGDGLRDLIVAVSVNSTTNQPPGNCITSTDCPHWKIWTGVSRGTGAYDWESQDTTMGSGWYQDQGGAGFEHRRTFTGDFDGDGRVDVLIAIQTATFTRLTVALNRGTGSSRWALTQQTVNYVTWRSILKVGDVDGDGTAELMLAFAHPNNNPVCNAPGTGPHYEVWNMRLGALGISTGFFIAPLADQDERLASGLVLRGEPDVIDVNGDDRMDWITVAPGGGGTYTVTDFPSSHDYRAAFKKEWRRADINGDGREDWLSVVFDNPGLRVGTVTTSPTGGLSRAADVVFPPSSFGESHAADSARDWFAADVGGPQGVPDGLTDLVVVDDRSGVVTTLLAQGNGSWARTPVRHSMPVTRTARHWLQADLNGDGMTDLVRLEPTTVVNSGPGATTPAVGLYALISRGDGQWRALSTTALAGAETPRLAAFKVIDLDGDRRADLVQLGIKLLATGTSFTTTVRTLRGQGDGSFVGASRPMSQPRPDVERFLVSDMNGDGRGDLARVDVATSTISFAYGVGNGAFSGVAIHPIGGTMAALATEHRGFRGVDLDEDGRTDFYSLMIERDSNGVPSTTMQIIWNRITGFYATPATGLAPSGTELQAPALADPQAFQLGDVDSDGRPDLVRFGWNNVHQIRLGAATTRMTEQSNGMGAHTSIVYTTSVGHAGDLPAGTVMPMVAQTSVHDDLTQEVIDVTDYTYDDIRFDHGRHQVLGVVQRTAAAGRSRTVTTYQVDGRCGARALVTELRDTTGRVITRTSYGFEPEASSSQARSFRCLVDTETYEQCEGQPTCRVTVDHTTNDAFGTPVMVWEEGDVTNASDDRVTIAPPNPNLATWVVSSPEYRVTYGSDPANGTWRMYHLTEFVYDDLPGRPPAAGLLTEQRVWNDQTGAMISSALKYDGWSNVVVSTGPATPHAPGGAKEYLQYDCTFHRFPVEVCDDLHCGHVQWNEPLQARGIATDANGEQATMHYDPLGRLVRVERPDGGETTWEFPATWNAAAQKVRSTLSDDSVNDHVFWTDTFLDAMGRPWRTVEEGGRAVDVRYDGLSTRPTQVSNPYLPGDTPRWTQHLYDAANRSIRETFPDGRATRTEYLVGRVDEYDELGAIKRFYADGFGRIAAVEEPVRRCLDGGDGCPIAARVMTTYGYDALGRRIWIRDANGNFTTSVFDSLSNRLATCSPDTGCEALEYADDGRATRQIDANQHVVKMEYDVLGRPRTRRTEAANGATTRLVTYAWDVDPATGLPIGASQTRLVGIEEQGQTAITRRRGYDPMGRVTSQRDCIDAQCMALSYDYDRAGRLEQVTYPDLQTVDYIYDHRGLLVSVPGYASFIYDDATSAPTRAVYQNGVIEDWRHAPDRLWLDEVAMQAKNGTFVEMIAHDATGRVQHVETIRGATSAWHHYSYDDLGRLNVVTSSDPAANATYKYDALGNRILDSTFGTLDYADPDHVHAVTGTGTGRRYAYDVEGQLLKSDDLELQWNEDGNPSEIVDRRTGDVTSYAYDATGERVFRSDPYGHEYTFGPLVELESGAMVAYVMARGRTIARRDPNGITYLHRDHLGSVRAVTNSAGDIVHEQDYTTWGARQPGGSTGTPGAIGFNGMRDGLHGLVHLGARYYDPAIGMFISADSLIPDPYTPQTLNAYAYALNDPASMTDLSGHAPQPGEWQHYDMSWGTLDVLTPDTGEVDDGECQGVPAANEPMPTPVVAPPSSPRTLDQWLRTTEGSKYYSDDQRDVDNANHFDDEVFANYADPIVHRLAALPRVLAAWDPTGVMEDKLDEADEIIGLGDSTPFGEHGRIALMALSSGGLKVAKNVARANQLRKLAKTGIALEIEFTKESIKRAARASGLSERAVKALINQKYIKANRYIQSGLIDARAGERIPYHKQDSKMFVKLVFEDAADVPLSKINITEFTGNGQVDEILSRFFGGPPLDFNQQIIPAPINALLGGAEHGAVLRQGVQDGTRIRRFKPVFLGSPRRYRGPARPHHLHVEPRAAEMAP